MSDVIEWVDGQTTYRVVGLGTKGAELLDHASRLVDQLAQRGAAAVQVLAEFEGPVSAVFHDQVVDVHATLAVLCRTVEAAGSACMHFPGPGRATYPSTPRFDAPNATGALSADPAALRAFGRASADWDAVAQRAGLAVNLDGVTATATVTRFATGPGGVPEEIVGPPMQVDPATLVVLPSAASVTARLVTLSSGAAELAGLTATAADSADSFWSSPGAFGRMLGFALQLQRNNGVPPRDLADNLQAFWLARGYDRAGIDPDTWVPALGATANRHNIEAVYTYYANLFLDHPELEWAGMANLMGPAFAAGFYDLALFRTLADAAEGPPMLPIPLWEVPGVPTPSLEALGDLTAGEIQFYESTLLQMQKDIFVDAAVMHEAYLIGGVPAIRELHRAGVIDRSAMDAWRSISRGSATGNQQLVSEGNTMLLNREQNQIITDSYDDMYTRFPSGPAVTYAMTLVGAPPIPGAKSFAEVYPLSVEIASTPDRIGTPDRVGTPERIGPFGVPSIGVDIPSVGVDLPHAVLEVDTPLPDGNLAHPVDRWSLINEDTLPVYQDHLENDPALVRELVSTPVGERIDDYRLINRLDEVDDMLTRWDVRVRWE